MIINNLKLLDTEFNGILTQLDRVLDKIETELSVEDRMAYFKRLCPPAMSTIYRLFGIRRQIEQEEAANGASQDNVYSTQSSIENYLPFVSAHASPPDPISKSQQCEGCGGLSSKSKESSKNNEESNKNADQSSDSDDQSSNNDDQSSNNDDQSSNNDDQSSNNDDQSSNNDDQSSNNDDQSSNNDDESSNSEKSKKTQRNSQHRDLDNTNFTNRRVSISPRLQEVLTRYMRDPRDIGSKIRRNPTQTAGGLPSAFLEIYDRGGDAELLALYRRFELRNFYLLAVDLDYHTGERWCRNASSDLAKQIKSQRPSLGLEQDELKECLNKFVRLGRKYGRWATELGGPGYLLAMPLGITERE
ncbi:hypothetical protein N7541_000617 [Penicillium brevicompactum]|uniref:Uncharacterized protein n=1 Tax=Penicillium brevicompactum TaxID=5074 RepID=A0A9W9RUP3_PENBR|nr:hypothetical protein N7541_000617 [Penicillium brevicompactum]